MKRSTCGACNEERAKVIKKPFLWFLGPIGVQGPAGQCSARVNPNETLQGRPLRGLAQSWKFCKEPWQKKALNDGWALIMDGQEQK